MAEKKYLDYTGLSHFYDKLKTRFGGGLTFQGSVANVAALPAISSLTVDDIGHEYSIQAAGKTTSDFVEGAGKAFSAGTNVALANVGTASSPSLKWDLLGTAFDRLPYGTEMPSSPESGDVFLYLGDTTYDYTEVTPTGDENPSEEGWYVSDGSSGYILTTDTTVQSGTTYYTRAEGYVQGVIYSYNGTSWDSKTAGDTFVAITTTEIDALFA